MPFANTHSCGLLPTARAAAFRNVMVHRFITKNTFEERINDMIQSKKALENMTVATGENWIGNLSNKELFAINI